MNQVQSSQVLGDEVVVAVVGVEDAGEVAGDGLEEDEQEEEPQELLLPCEQDCHVMLLRFSRLQRRTMAGRLIRLHQMGI